MNWRLEKACSLSVFSQGKGMAPVVKVELVAGLLDRFCVGLCLLQKGLVDSLDLVGTRTAQVIRLQSAARATSIQFDKGKIVLALDTTELERWVHFTLRTVRDGVAEVDHFDVEASSEKHEAEATTVVVVFPSSAPSVSPAEARRRLGL